MCSVFILILILIFQEYEAFKSHFLIKIYQRFDNSFLKEKVNLRLSSIISNAAMKSQFDGSIFLF